MLSLAALLALLASAAELGPVPEGTVRVFLMRHGQALSNLDPTPDLPPEKLDHLTPLGVTQARNAAGALRGAGIAAILTSPAGRARETADLLRPVLAAGDVRVEARLRPLDLGRRKDGKPFDWDERIAEWTAGRDPVPEGGESLEAVGRRVLDAVQSLLPEHQGRSVLLVAHSEVIGAFTAILDGAPPISRWPPKVPNGSLTVVEARAGTHPTVIQPAHVPAPPLVASPHGAP